ncbi:hypothetical protein [Halorubellus salinus]|uniref:hypothetical protein n=1 Tax=Halorubellus salinus TaxID=755309 RepID=UPI001D090624|nr:hypothetical protein [Halorubellus salinus]
MPSRRRALALLSGALAATSGCVSSVFDDDPPLEHGERMRATGDPVSRTLDGWPLDHEYVAGNDTVRYQDATDTYHYDPVVWAAWEGERTVEVVLGNRFEPSLFDRPGVRVGTEGEGRDTRAFARHQTHRKDFETGTIEPGLSTTELVETLPTTVTVTVPLQEQEWTIDYPVFVERYDYVEHTAEE